MTQGRVGGGRILDIMIFTLPLTAYTLCISTTAPRTRTRTQAHTHTHTHTQIIYNYVNTVQNGSRNLRHTTITARNTVHMVIQLQVFRESEFTRFFLILTIRSVSRSLFEEFRNGS